MQPLNDLLPGPPFDCVDCFESHRREPIADYHPGRTAARDIPMRCILWDEPTPGHFETGLVHHSGVSVATDYVHTLQHIDVTTG